MKLRNALTTGLAALAIGCDSPQEATPANPYILLAAHFVDACIHDETPRLYDIVADRNRISEGRYGGQWLCTEDNEPVFNIYGREDEGYFNMILANPFAVSALQSPEQFKDHR